MSLAQEMVTAPERPEIAPAKPNPAWTLLRRIMAQPKGAVGLTLVVLYLLLAILGPALAPQDAFRQNFVMQNCGGKRLQPRVQRGEDSFAGGGHFRS